MGGERERQWILPSGLSVKKVLCQELADSLSQEKYSPSDDDGQASGECESMQWQLHKDELANFSFFHLFVPPLGERTC